MKIFPYLIYLGIVAFTGAFMTYLGHTLDKESLIGICILIGAFMCGRFSSK